MSANIKKVHGTTFGDEKHNEHKPPGILLTASYNVHATVLSHVNTT